SGPFLWKMLPAPLAAKTPGDGQRPLAPPFYLSYVAGPNVLLGQPRRQTHRAALQSRGDFLDHRGHRQQPATGQVPVLRIEVDDIPLLVGLGEAYELVVHHLARRRGTGYYRAPVHHEQVVRVRSQDKLEGDGLAVA